MKKIICVLFLVALNSSIILSEARAEEAPSEESRSSVSEKTEDSQPPKMQYKDLTENERKILSQGEISTGQHVAGGLVSTFVGFGIGQAIEGRYSDTGWIFTVGELGSITLLMAGAGSCLGGDVWSKSGCSSGEVTAMLVGYFGYLGFRVWDIIDAWAGPASHNQRYRNLKEMTEPSRVSFYVLPAPSGAVTGLQFRF